MSLAVVTKKAIDALLGGSSAGIIKTHPPFTKRCRGVTGRLGDFGDRYRFVGQRKLAFGWQFEISANGTMPTMEAGEKARPAGCANGR